MVAQAASRAASTWLGSGGGERGLKCLDVRGRPYTERISRRASTWLGSTSLTNSESGSGNKASRGADASSWRCVSHPVRGNACR